jgi:hypothetical protein
MGRISVAKRVTLWDDRAVNKNGENRTCAWCGAPLPPANSRLGHPRWYCSAACREKAYRKRKAEKELQRVLVEPHVPPTDEQIALTILEAQSAAAAFTRLGLQVRPRLAERCLAVGQAIEQALEANFPGLPTAEKLFPPTPCNGEKP